MGTRADFYVGSGKNAEWLGSVAWDGYEWEDSDNDIHKVKNETEYREYVNNILVNRDDATFPKDGWPWPWNDSNTTDCIYSYENNKVNCYGFKDDEIQKEWPDMSKIKNVNFGKRSGLVVISK